MKTGWYLIILSSSVEPEKASQLLLQARVLRSRHKLGLDLLQWGRFVRADSIGSTKKIQSMTTLCRRWRQIYPFAEIEINDIYCQHAVESTSACFLPTSSTSNVDIKLDSIVYSLTNRFAHNNLSFTSPLPRTKGMFAYSTCAPKVDIIVWYKL